MYRNDAGTNFVAIDAGLTDLAEGSVNSGDFDGDGDLDIILTGRIGDGTASTLYYRNDGGGAFSYMNLNLLGVVDSALAVADYDNDGDLDFVLSGYSSEGRATRLYRNIRNGNDLEFELVSHPVTYVDNGSLAWGNVDNDGHIDLALTGRRGTLPFADVYRNNGDGTFSAMNFGLMGGSSSSTAWGDFDGDGDLDLLLTEQINQTGPDTSIHLYENFISASNSAPSAPTSLAGSGTSASATIEWQAASDVETTASALTYNVILATSPDGRSITSPMADVTNGFRRVVQRGNAGENLFWTFNGLEPGTYYFTVQAIDSTFTGGPFAPWTMITIAAQPIVIVTTEIPTAGQMRLRFVGPENGAYEVWRSTDLVAWSMIGLPIEISAGLFEFLDVASPADGAFYRIQSNGTGND